MNLRRWLKREWHKHFYLRNYCIKVSFLLFVGFILLMQMHTLMTSRRNMGSVEFHGGHYRVHHQDNDDDDDVDHHYIMAVGDTHKKLGLQRQHDVKVVIDETERGKLDPKLRNSHQLRISTPGRLGNSMFAYASLLGIAKENHMVPLLREDDLLFKSFDLSVKTYTYNKKEKNAWPQLTEAKPASYDTRTQLLNHSVNIELDGYFQSWKYFWNIREHIRQEFVFKQEIQSFVEEFVQNIVHEFLGPDTILQDVIYVGIHIRRGDMLEPHNIEKGYTVAPREYLMAAVKYFEDKYDPQKLVFMVCSDDMIWVKTNMRQHKAPMVYSLFHDAAQDLAILSRCHHVITTVGTFSWWAGFLSGGTVVYYKDFPREGSSVGEFFSSEDFFPIDWIGIGNKDFL